MGQSWEILGDGLNGSGSGYRRGFQCAGNRCRMGDQGRQLTDFLQMSEKQLKACW
jgi:hypothetical protein